MKECCQTRWGPTLNLLIISWTSIQVSHQGRRLVHLSSLQLFILLVLKFERPFYYLLICLKTAANSVDPIQYCILQHLVWVFTVCLGLSVPIFRINMVLQIIEQGPVVQSLFSLKSSLRVTSLTVLADSIHNILIIFAEKM